MSKLPYDLRYMYDTNRRQLVCAAVGLIATVAFVLTMCLL
jgi:hypothetical protein